MAANGVSSDSVVVLLYKDDGMDVRTDIMETEPCEYDKGYTKEISDMDGEALPLEMAEKKVSREKTVEALVEAVLCEYEVCTRKANSDMDVDALPL